MWRWSEAVEPWSTQQKALLMAGWRKSTLNTYKPAWERWVKWCQSSDISPINPVARGPAKAASRTVIAGWVKSVLSNAGVDATPGSVRSAVVSRGWLDSEPLDKILSRAKKSRKSVKTFSKFYKKEIRPLPNVISDSVSLRALFKPVR
ncbi:unnamed protein product, partial [Brenthis ino]